MRSTMNLKTLMEKKVDSRPQDVETVVEPVEELLGMDKEKAAKKLASLSIDDQLSLIDSVRHANKDEVIDLLDETFGIGQEVKVKGEEGVVKIPKGPGDTAGVMIDGELKMVKNNEIAPLTESEQLDEAILGMSRLPGIGRMMELAGIKGEEEEKKEGEAAPENTGIRPAADAPAPAAPAAPEAPEAVQVPAAPEVATVEVATVVPNAGEYEPMELPAACDNVAEEKEAAPALETVRAALDQIEGCITNLTVSEYREIRDRLTKLQNVLFESIGARRKKPV